MATHLKIKTEYETSVHFDGVFDDHTLCGLTTSNDERMKIFIKNAVKTKVSCRDCIRIVQYCHGINKNEFNSK